MQKGNQQCGRRWRTSPIVFLFCVLLVILYYVRMPREPCGRLYWTVSSWWQEIFSLFLFLYVWENLEERREFFSSSSFFVNVQHNNGSVFFFWLMMTSLVATNGPAAVSRKSRERVERVESSWIWWWWWRLVFILLFSAKSDCEVNSREDLVKKN